MGYLIPILLAVGVQALGQSGRTSGLVLPGGVLLLVGLPYVVASLARRLSLGGRWRLAAGLGRLASLGGVIAYFFAVWGLGWVQAVQRITGAALDLNSWPEPALLLTFAPYVLFQVAAIDAEARISFPPGAARRRLRTFQVRMFISALVPLGAYAGLSIVVGWSEFLRVHVETVDLVEALFVAGLLVVLGALLPVLLRNTWETVPLPPGRERELFESVARKAEFSAQEVLLWRTGNLVANAAIVGLTAKRRVVLLSDSLLHMLDERELANVFAHEIGHSKRGHVAIFLGWAMFFFLGGDLLGRAVFGAEGWGSSAVLLGALVFWYYGFGWLSRRFELEADLFAMQLTGDPTGLIDALEKVGGRLRDVAGWRHFSTSKRVRFLHRATFDEVFRLRFLRRIRVWGMAGLVLGVAVTGVQGFLLAKRWPEDRLLADLALGRYEAVIERTEGRTDLDPEYLALAREGRQVVGPDGEGGRDADLGRLVDALGDALTSGELSRARMLADLCSLRGRRTLVPVAEALASLEDGESVGPGDLERLPEPWGERVSAALRSAPPRRR